ncbi:MAG: cation diffusion facilitator family transporter [Sedimenticola sp.]
MAHGSTKAVITAIISNSIVTVIKFIAATVSGSAAMMNEAVHSLMDTLNQSFLFLGLREGNRPADSAYAFGHGQKKYLWNLWSAIGLFSIGAGLGLSHAWHSWHDMGHAEEAEPLQLLGLSIDPLSLNLLVLAIAFVLEGYSFLVALKEFLAAMKRSGHSNPFGYLLKSDDPTLVAVVLEDAVAMIGLAFAALGIGLSAVTGNPAWDILFSAAIAVMLGVIAFYLGYTNMLFLAGMRDTRAESAFMEVAAAHKEVERYHDLRSIIIDENNTVLVAEIELSEEQVIPGLFEMMEEIQEKIRESLPPEQTMKKEAACYIAANAAAQATLTRTEQIIDELEVHVKRLAPQVSHVTLEVEGIAPPPKPGTPDQA